MLRFFHTADWHIGARAFAFAEPDKAAALRDARVGVIDRIGEAAGAAGATVILVAGDVFDAEKLSNKTLLAPLERMRRFSALRWYLMPGNHDPDRPEQLWDRLAYLGLPQNVALVRTARPMEIGDNAWLLPAPLTARDHSDDPTDWMDTAETPPGAFRIGLAHGSIRDFSGQGETSLRAAIAPDRAAQAGLDYLALGDWHRVRRIDARTWYSGTPEPEAFYPPGEPDGGEVLSVAIAGPGAEPRVTPVRTGRYRWAQLAANLHCVDDIEALVARARGLDDDPARVFLRLRVSGALSLADRAAFDDRVGDRLAAALFALNLRDDKLLSTLSEGDLDAIDREGGMVRIAAETLRRQAEAGSTEDSATAHRALELLYRFVRHESRGERA